MIEYDLFECFVLYFGFELLVDDGDMVGFCDVECCGEMVIEIFDFEF